MRKRKPNNMAKRINALSSALIKPMAITWVSNDKNKDDIALAEAWHVSLQKRVKVTEDLYKAFVSTKTYWKVYIAVFCRDQLNQEYVQGRWIETNEPYKQIDLADFLNDQHLALWKECNPMHKMNLGWVAFVGNKKRTDEEAIKLMEMRNCWDTLSPHELKEQVTNNDKTN